MAAAMIALEKLLIEGERRRSPPAVVAHQRPVSRHLPTSLTNSRGQRRPARLSDPFPEHEASVDRPGARGEDTLCISPSSTASGESQHNASNLSSQEESEEGSSANTPAYFDSSATDSVASSPEQDAASPSRPSIMPRMSMSRRHEANSPAAQFGRLAGAIYPSPAKRVLMPPPELGSIADDENVPPAGHHSSRLPRSPHSKNSFSTPQKRGLTPTRGFRPPTPDSSPYPHNGASPYRAAKGKQGPLSPQKGVPSPHKRYIRDSQAPPSPEKGARGADEDFVWDEEQMRKAVEDVEAFAKYLGMDVKEDRKYFWIAVEAMIAPLPPNWAEYYDKDQPYYHNESTDHTQWEHPLDEYHRQLYIKTKAKDQEHVTKPKKSATSQTAHKSSAGTTAARNYSAHAAKASSAHTSEHDGQHGAPAAGTHAHRPRNTKAPLPPEATVTRKAPKKSVTEKLSKKIFNDHKSKQQKYAVSGGGEDGKEEMDERHGMPVSGKKDKWWKRTFLPLRDKTNSKV